VNTSTQRPTQGPEPDADHNGSHVLGDEGGHDYRRLFTARLDLRAIDPDDGDLLFPLLSDPLLSRHEPSARHIDVSQSREYAALASQRWGDGLSYWLVRAISDDQVIGHGGVQLHCGHHWNISYRLSSAAQGHGYATELAAAARETANLLRPHLPVIAWIDPANTASQRVADRIGLTCRGLRRARPDRPPLLAYSDRDLSDDTFPRPPRPEASPQ
jgi:RimJ/RimL family protein N-acetyltransferase